MGHSSMKSQDQLGWVLVEDRGNTEWLIEEGTYKYHGTSWGKKYCNWHECFCQFFYECVCTDICIFPRFCNHVT